ncbi:MAG TPA: pitrilysin family protein [Gemmatimonadales bacterium]|nr:pitrilysin family protein [Gemmatimonadales bacterium]
MRSQRVLGCVLLPLVVAAVAAPAGLAQAPQSALARLVHRTRLPNGLEVIVLENRVVPLAEVLVAVHNGAFTQDSTEEGLAHLYEHILFRSYRGDPDAFGAAVGELNGRYDGATGQEVVYYFVAVPSKQVEKAVQLMARLVQAARFSKSDLRDERPVVLDELQRGESDPEQRLARQGERALWGSSWSRKDVGGDSTSLAGITLDRLQEKYARYYVPNNAALIVTGDVSSTQVFEQAKRSFGDWSPGPDPFASQPIPPIAPRKSSTAVLVGSDVLDVTIRIAFQGPGVASDTAATYAADALFEVLNDPASAFQRRLVENGPFLSVSGGYATRARVGSIEFVGKTTAERARAALLALVGELDQRDLLLGVADQDLADAKQRRLVRTVLDFEQTALLAPELAFWWGSAGMDYYLTYNDHMAAQTLEDLRRFAGRYVVAQPRVIGVLGPPLTIQQLSAALRETVLRANP